MKPGMHFIAGGIVISVVLVLGIASGKPGGRRSPAATVRPSGPPRPPTPEERRKLEAEGTRLAVHLEGVEGLSREEQARRVMRVQEEMLNSMNDQLPPDVRANWEAELRRPGSGPR